MPFLFLSLSYSSLSLLILLSSLIPPTLLLSPLISLFFVFLLVFLAFLLLPSFTSSVPFSSFSLAIFSLFLYFPSFHYLSFRHFRLPFFTFFLLFFFFLFFHIRYFLRIRCYCLRIQLPITPFYVSRNINLMKHLQTSQTIKNGYKSMWSYRGGG